MFVDASALVAIVAGEADAEMLGQKLVEAEARLTSPVAIYEATLALARLGNTSISAGQGSLQGLLDYAGIELVSITPDIGRIAIEAFARFGRGKHPARLNMGDCFAYACARSLGVPLLAKGEDFPLTDIELA